MGATPTQVTNQDVIEVPINGHDTIADWLLSLGLQHYLSLFVSNGFDDVNFLVRIFFPPNYFERN